MSTTPEVMDYEGSGYKTDFWEGKGRDYEDQVERVALHRLLPPKGKRLLELGAGFGRLTHEYAGYEQVVLVDYSSTLLADAQARLGKSERFVYVAANIYELPIADATCDAAAMIRVIHHFADVPAALRQIHPTLAKDGVFVLEFANKRNLKAVLRYLLRRQTWSPFDFDPIEFVKLNFDFHPSYIQKSLQSAGFTTERSLAVSYLRLGILKRTLPTALLVQLDSLLQYTPAYSPSVFTRNVASGQQPLVNNPNALFKCPKCQHSAWQAKGDVLTCEQCGARWGRQDGIYNFKIPLE